MSLSTPTHPEVRTGSGVTDFLPLNGIDHIEFYAGNARQAAYFYRAAFGFSLTGYRGPETGKRDSVGYLLEQGNIRLVFTSPLKPTGPIAEHVARHGDGVHSIALEVDNAEMTWRAALDHGARPAGDRDFSIALYGDTIHRFVEPGATRSQFARMRQPDPIARPVGLTAIDHVVGNVGWGEMNAWVRFYENVMGFQLYQHFDDKDISTEYSALMSKVMANGNGRVKFPINEPAEGRKKSQIEEYLDFYGGPGVQHIAMVSGGIIDTVARLRAQGIEFLSIPRAYYDELQGRIGKIDEPLDRLAELGILVDRDDEGYMLQIFTKPVEDRPTLFYEIIQRKGSRSFGKGNFKALFEAIEREQARRGNL
jgi:4-hydroxyphenylpyruvate dioxygenase